MAYYRCYGPPPKKAKRRRLFTEPKQTVNVFSFIICLSFHYFFFKAEELPFHDLREILRALQLNTHQQSQVLTANGHSVDDMWKPQHAHKLYSDWLKSAAINHSTKNLEAMAGKVAKQYILALQKMSSHVTASLSSYDLHAMVCGIAVLVQTLYWVVSGLLQLTFQSKRQDWLNESVFIVSGTVLLVTVLHLSACSSTVIGKKINTCIAMISLYKIGTILVSQFLSAFFKLSRCCNKTVVKCTPTVF